MAVGLVMRGGGLVLPMQASASFVNGKTRVIGNYKLNQLHLKAIFYTNSVCSFPIQYDRLSRFCSGKH